MSALAVYVPRDSVVHRLPAGTKLLLLVPAAIGVLALSQPWQVVVALAVIALLYAAARIPWRTTLEQVRPLLWFLLALGLFQLAVAGWQRAVVVVGAMLGLVLLATLVSLTTRTTAMVDVVVRWLRPLRPVGVDPGRDLGLGQVVPPQPEGDVLGNGRHDDLGIGIGEAESDAAPDRTGVPGRVEAVDPDHPGGRDDEGVEHPGKGRLARPVGADDADPALGEPQGDLSQHDPLDAGGGVGVPHGVELDQRHASTASAVPCPPPAAIAARP